MYTSDTIIVDGVATFEIISVAEQGPAGVGMPVGGTAGQVPIKNSDEDYDYFYGDHGDIGGLDDDDHPQYLNEVRGDARYYTQSVLDGLLDNKSDVGHTHVAADITDFADAVLNVVDAASVTSVNGMIGDVVLDTDDINEGSTNKYFTDNRAKDAAGAAVGNTSNIHITYNSGPRTITADLTATGVTGGTYKSVTVDVYGRVTGGTNPTTLTGFGIVDAQPLDATLTALAGVTTASDKLIYATGSDSFSTTDFTSFGRQLVASADATATKTLISLDNVTNVAQLPLSYLDTDGLLSADSDTRVPSQKAVRSFVSQAFAANDAMMFRGAIDASSNPNYPAGNAGDVYKISVAGKIGGASGPNVEVNDMVTCSVDGSLTGNHATVGANWFITQANLDGAVIGPAGATDGYFPLFDGVSGRLIKNSTYAPASFLLASNNLSDVTASTARTNLGLGTIATQDASGVAITGGTINGTTIGATSAVSGRFTTITPTSSSAPTLGMYAPESNHVGIAARSARSVSFTNPVTAVNWLVLSGSATGTAVSITPNSATDTNVDLSLAGLGTGKVSIASVAITGGTIDGTVIGGTTSANATIDRLGVGVAASSNYRIYTYDSVANPSGQTVGANYTSQITISSNNANQGYGMFTTATYYQGAFNGTNSSASLIAARSLVQAGAGGTGTITSLVSHTASATNASAGTVTSLYGYLASVFTNTSTGSVTNVFAFKCPDQTIGTALNVAYQGAMSAGTGKYNLYMDGSAQNYISGVTGIGTLPASNAALTISKTFADPSASTYATTATNTITLTGANSTSNFGVYGQVVVTPGAFNATATAIATAGRFNAATTAGAGQTGTITGLIANNASITHQAPGTLTNAYNYYVNTVTSTGSGPVTNNYGLYIADQDVGTNVYGIRSLITAGSNKYNVYVDGTAQNYFAGNSAVGSTLPTTTTTLTVGAIYNDPAASTFQLNITSSTNQITSNNAQVWDGLSTNLRLNQNGFNATATVSLRSADLYTYTSGSSGTVTGVANIYSVVGNIAAGTLTNAYHHYIAATQNSGGGTLTNNYGIYVADQTAGTNIYGYRSVISAGTNKYNLYIDGTASNYFGGAVNIAPPAPAGTSLTANFVNITGTLNTTNTAPAAGVNITVNSAGSSGQGQMALYSNLSAGYTGSSFTYGVFSNNSAAGTGTGGITATQANYGMYSQVQGTTAGNNVGFGTYVLGSSSRNIGLSALAVAASNGALNVGVVGLGLNTGTTPTQIGGYFGLQSSVSSFTSAALIADNGSTSSPVFIGRVNGTAANTIDATGRVTIAPAATSATPSATAGWFNTSSATFTDNATLTSGTATLMAFNSFATPTLAATNSTVTTTDAATVYIAAAPTAGTNQTITRAWALMIAAGNLNVAGNIVPATAALSTSATNGFIYSSSCAGTPSGTPTAFSGRVPFVVDSTNNKLYIYNSGWKFFGAPTSMIEAQLQGTITASTYVIVTKARFSFTINGIYGVKHTSGTSTLAVKINGTNVTGMSAISVTSTAQDVTASGANTVAVGDQITFVFSSVSSPADLFSTLDITRT